MSLKLAKCCHILPKLRPVDVNDIAHCAFLFGVLNRRLQEPKTNISHKKQPEWTKHLKYIRGKPHGNHNYLVTSGEWFAGHCYVTRQNEIGVWIAPEYRSEGFGQWATERMIEIARQRGEVIFANVSPKNQASLRLFKKLGFRERKRTTKQITLEKPSDGKASHPSVASPNHLPDK